MIKTVSGRHTEAACREACAKEPDCGNFLYGKSTGGVPNRCSLYKKGSEKICTDKEKEGYSDWTFYALKDCKAVIGN